MYSRYALQSVLAALSDTPVVFLRGARQTGKSTLAKMIVQDHHPASMTTLDRAVSLAAAKRDPEGFLASLPKPAVIDEVQRVPELLLAVKADVDENRQPGRYLLTGSANILTMPRVHDTLAGRMEIVTLWPLSMAEIEHRKPSFIDTCFSGQFGFEHGRTTGGLAELITRGGYPEIVSRKEQSRRSSWFESYVTTLVERDLKDIAGVSDASAMLFLLKLLAARSATIVNQSELSRAANQPYTTLRRYLAVLQTAFLIHFVPAWSANLGKRLVKSPKVFLIDTGLACHLASVSSARLNEDGHLLGHLLEAFVASELVKQLRWAETRTDLFHFRSQAGLEVDFLLEDAGGRVVALEVKAAKTVTARDFKSLAVLGEILGDRLARGIVLYDGETTAPFGDKLWAVPVTALWS